VRFGKTWVGLWKHYIV